MKAKGKIPVGLHISGLVDDQKIYKGFTGLVCQSLYWPSLCAYHKT